MRFPPLLRATLLCLVTLTCVALPARATPGFVHVAPRHAGDLHTAAIQERPETQFLPTDPATLWLKTRRQQPRLMDPVLPTDLQTVHLGGSTAQSLDIVLVADGFTADERDAFFVAAGLTSDALLSWPPYVDYASLFNVYAFFVASPQSGASHPSAGVYVDNAFGTTFDYGGVTRLAVADDAKVLDAVAHAFPAFDIAVVVVNDAEYGGSGGAVPVVSMATDAIAILRHELGHNLGHLADEYDAPYPGYPAGDGEPNVTSFAHLEPLKWHAWVKDATPIPSSATEATSLYTPVGAYEGARYKTVGMFRPAPNCLMRSLDMAFCSVCAEALIVAIHKSTSMLRSRLPGPSPIVTCTVGECPTFTVETAPIATVQLQWLRDGQYVATGPSWTPGVNDVGEHTLTLRVFDATDAVLDDPDHALVEEAVWNLHVDATTPPPDDSVRALDCGTCGGDVVASPAPAQESTTSGCQAGRTSATVWPLLAAFGLLARRKRTA